jgi:hypothetical protein
MSTVVRVVARRSLGQLSPASTVSTRASVISPDASRVSVSVPDPGMLAPVTRVDVPAATAPFSIGTPPECLTPRFKYAGQIKPITADTTVLPRTVVLYGGMSVRPGIGGARDRIVDRVTTALRRIPIPTKAADGRDRFLEPMLMGALDPSLIFVGARTPDAPIHGPQIGQFINAQVSGVLRDLGFGGAVGNTIVPSSEIASSPVQWTQVGSLIAGATEEVLRELGAGLVTSIALQNSALSAIAGMEHRNFLLIQGALSVQNVQTIADNAVALARTAENIADKDPDLALQRIAQARQMIEEAAEMIDAASIARTMPGPSGISVETMVQSDLNAGLSKFRSPTSGHLAIRCAMVKVAQGRLPALTARKAAAVAAEPGAVSAWDGVASQVDRAFEILETADDRITAIEEGLFKGESFLTRKVGPLPVWAWGTIGVAVPGAIYMKMRGVF